MTIDGWRAGRGPDGYPLTPKERRAMEALDAIEEEDSEEEREDRIDEEIKRQLAFEAIPCRRADDEDLEALSPGESTPRAGPEGRRGDVKEAEGQVDPQPPALVQASYRLASDVQALQELLKGDVPIRHRFRASERLTAFYLPGDASGAGFGSALIDQAGNVVYESGTWH